MSRWTTAGRVHGRAELRADVRPGYLLPHRTTVLAISASLLGVVLAASGQTILLTAMPAVSAAVGGAHDYSWLFSAYLLTMAVSVPLYGRLSDVYGRRPFLLGAIALYMAGGVVGALGQTIEQLVVCRAVQGLAAGALVVVPLAVVADLVPPSDRGRWQGFFGAAIAAASLLGPLGGGWLADHASWRLVFLAPLPLGAIAFTMVFLTVRVPRHPDRRTGIDVAGAALLTLAVGSALVATAIGGHQVAWDAPLEVALFAVAAAAAVGFVIVERRSPHPLLPLSVLSSRTVLAASIAGFGTGICHFSAMTFIPFFVQGALGASATAAGLVLMPMLLSMVAATLVSGQLIARLGRYRWALICGPVVASAGYAWLATLDADASWVGILGGTVVVGLGLGLLWQNLILVVQNVSSDADAGVATSTGQLCRSLGNTVGVTVMGAIVSAGLAAGDLALASDASPGVRAQTAHAIHPVFVVSIPVCLVILVAVWRIPETPLRRRVREDPAAAPVPAA